MRLSKKVVLVMGGTSGIGLATALRFVEEDAHVIAVGREGDRLRRAGDLLGGRAEVLPADITDPQSLAAMFSDVGRRHGGLDVLVISAGVSEAPEIGDLLPSHYDALMDVNCKGLTFTFVQALPLLSQGASVVFVGSVSGRKGQPGDPLYAGSKGYVRAFARSAGTDPTLMQRGIRVNVVSPGPIDTPMTKRAVENAEADAYVRSMIPMGRWGRAEEVADAILFLASDASRFTTGAEIMVDGGMSHA